MDVFVVKYLLLLLKSLQEYVDYFNKVYSKFVKRQYQMKTSPDYGPGLCSFIENKSSHKRMKSESVHLMVTSPSYYDARNAYYIYGGDDYVNI
jgi:hypothetical protein